MTIYLVCRGNETVDAFTNYIEAYTRCKMLNEGFDTDEFKIIKRRMF